MTDSSLGAAAVPPLFAALVAGYADGHDHPPSTETVSLAAALVAGDDPWRIISYLSGLGIIVRNLDDLLAINADPYEEELHAWPCQEGVAVSIASDGIWVLFVP